MHAPKILVFRFHGMLQKLTSVFLSKRESLVVTINHCQRAADGLNIVGFDRTEHDSSKIEYVTMTHSS